jgi:hypothetical protein
MHDVERADLLHCALQQHEELPPDLDDAELGALAQLGAELERRGPNLALMQHADAEFDADFAGRLRETLVSGHPGATGQQEAPSRHMLASKSASLQFGNASSHAARTRAYRAMLMPFILVALIVTTVNAIMHSSPSARTARGVATATQVAARSSSYYAKGLSGGTPEAGSGATRAPLGGVYTVSGSGFSANATVAVTFAASRPAAAPTGTTAPRFGALVAPAPQGTPAPTAPQNSDMPSVAMGTTSASVAAAGAQSLPTAVLRLPAKLPRFPATAPVYAMHYVPLSTGDKTRIVGTFQGFAPTVPDNYASASGGELSVFRAAGNVMYSVGRAGTTRADSAALAPSEAIQKATTWLKAHYLYPAGTLGRGLTVTFTPKRDAVVYCTPLPTSTPSELSPVCSMVTLDAKANVIFADVEWVMLAQHGSKPLLSVAAALAAAPPLDLVSGPGLKIVAGALQPPTRSETVMVTAITLTYEPSGQNVQIGQRASTPGSAYEPYYRLAGHVAGQTGSAAARTFWIPAVAP